LQEVSSTAEKGGQGGILHWREEPSQSTFSRKFSELDEGIKLHLNQHPAIRLT